MRNRGWLFPLRLATLVVALGTLTLAAGSALPGVEAPSTAAADDAPANQHTCSGGTKTPDPSPLSPPVIQTCTVTSASGYCIQRSSAPVVVQTCTFNQTGNPGVRKTGYAIQEARANGVQGTQDARQIILVTQNNTGASGSASFTYTQRVDQEQNAGSSGGDGDDDDEEDSSGPPAAAIDQRQQSHQSVDITQTTSAGSVLATGVQRLGQEQRAANAVAIEQHQNTDDENNDCGPAGAILGPLDDPVANQCATFRQSSTSGSLRATPDQRYTQFQRASDASTGQQAQGSLGDPASGGLDLRYKQSSAGVALWDSDQDESQTQHRDNTGAMTWEQHGPVRKGSGDQATNPNNLSRIDQTSVQFSGEDCGGGDGDDDGDDGDDEGDDDEGGDDDEEGSCVPAFDGFQTNVLTAFATTTGDCVANLTAVQNGDEEHANEPAGDGPPDACAEYILCGDVGMEPPQDEEPPILTLAPEDAIVIFQSESCVSSDEDIDIG